MKTQSKESPKEVDYTYIENPQGEHNNLDFQKNCLKRLRYLQMFNAKKLMQIENYLAC